MAFNINKTRLLKMTGLSDVTITSPVFEWSRMQNNGDGTITVILDIYQDKATFDAPNSKPYDQRSYQINTHPNVDKFLSNQLKLIEEFNSIT